MTSNQIPLTSCPPTCLTPRCGQLVIIKPVKGELVAFCAAGHPMHPECGWHTRHAPRSPLEQARDGKLD